MDHFNEDESTSEIIDLSKGYAKGETLIEEEELTSTSDLEEDK